MQMTLKRPKPRNPLVAASLKRMAGPHRRSPSAKRQQAARDLRMELRTVRDPFSP